MSHHQSRSGIEYRDLGPYRPPPDHLAGCLEELGTLYLSAVSLHQLFTRARATGLELLPEAVARYRCELHALATRLSALDQQSLHQLHGGPLPPFGDDPCL